MRASFQKELIPHESYQLKGDTAHHLINVVRVEINEEILLINGLGLKVKTKVSSLSKRELILTKIEMRHEARGYVLDLALGIPKKEALELSLKQAVELGVRKIYLIRAEFSQTRLPETERLQSLLISALEQSNGAYLPEIILSDWDKIPTSEYDEIFMMDSQSEGQKVNLSNRPRTRLLIVGPEGGFSQTETEFLHKMPEICVLNLPTPILRTPTAVAVGAGILIGSLLD